MPMYRVTDKTASIVLPPSREKERGRTLKNGEIAKLDKNDPGVRGLIEEGFLVRVDDKGRGK